MGTIHMYEAVVALQELHPVRRRLRQKYVKEEVGNGQCQKTEENAVV